jgi:hypothetical protein
MAIGGNNKKRRTGRGTYAGTSNVAGSQVASGGNAARSRTVHNGAGGTRQGGGHGAAGSQPAVNRFKPEALRSVDNYKGPAGFFRRGSAGYGYINKQGNTATAAPQRARSAQLLRNPLQPRRTTGGIAPNIGGAINPARPAAPIGTGPAHTPDFTTYQDADYFDDLRELQSGYEGEINPYLSELESLKSTSGIGGKTLYDTLYSKAQDEFGQNVLGARDAASKRGLLVSGAFDRTRSGLSGDWLQQQQDLYNRVGAGRISELQRLQQNAELRRQQALGNLQRAASARGQQYWQTLLANRYENAANSIPEDPFYGFGLGE